MIGTKQRVSSGKTQAQRVPAAEPRPLTEALRFVLDACARLNDARAVENCDRFMLDEELTDIENVCARALSTPQRK